MSHSNLTVGEQIEVHIEKLAYGGSGIARHQGVVIFVPYSAPNDHLKIEITEKKKNYYNSTIIKLIKPGESRIEPPCPVFEKCGGCNLQHLKYSEQLIQKNFQIKEALNKLNLPYSYVFEDIEPSPKEFNYRNRTQIKTDGKKYGYFAKRSHEIISVDQCLLLEPVLNEKFTNLRKNFKSPSSEIQNIHLASDDDRTQTFTQVNRYQNELLVKTFLNWSSEVVEKSKIDFFYDFCCGSGNFTFPFIERFKPQLAVGIELSAESIKVAKERSLQLGIPTKNIKFFAGDIEFFLRRNLFDENSIILIDPPRSGCTENTISYLSRIKCRRLFYISCDPSNLQRDLGRLIRHNSKWRLLRSKSFDMFPQTHHIESLVELTLE